MNGVSKSGSRGRRKIKKAKQEFDDEFSENESADGQADTNIQPTRSRGRSELNDDYTFNIADTLPMKAGSHVSSPFLTEVSDIGPIPSYPPIYESVPSNVDIPALAAAVGVNDADISLNTPQGEALLQSQPITIPKLNELFVQNPELEKMMDLDKFGLTVEDVDKFHQFYFNSNNIRPFNYSIDRYFKKLAADFDQVFHFSLLIWTLASFYIDESFKRSEFLYNKALDRLTFYWESNKDSFRSEILFYLHSLCLKAQFEFMTGREMRAALTISSAIRLLQMFGYDQIDLSKDMLLTPTIFFKSFKNINENILLQDDGFDFDIPLVEERRRVLWEIYVLDKWSSLVSGLPCALSVDNHSVIFTKLPSPTTFLPLQNTDLSSNKVPVVQQSYDDSNKSSFYLHEAMAKLDRNQVLIDINSSSSKVLLLTISENIIKWCKMFLNMVELDSLKSDLSIDSIRNKVTELVKNFESMHNNLLFFDLTTEPLMNIVITNTTTLLYQSVLIKFSSLFDLQLKEGSIISLKQIQLFNDLLTHVSNVSSKLVLKFINKTRMEYHLKKVPIFIVLLNSIKSLFQCAAFYKRFSNILIPQPEQMAMTINTLKLVSEKFNTIGGRGSSVVEKIRMILKNGDELLQKNPNVLSFFDSFYESM